MPLRELVHALGPECRPRCARRRERLSYRDFLTVALVLDREHLFPDNWIYIHTPGVKVGRIQNFNNWSRAMVPEPGRTCLGLEYFCFEGDGLWASHDADLIELATRELRSWAWPRGERWSTARGPDAESVSGLRFGLPRHRDRVRVHRPVPNLHRGRNGMHKYNNQDHSMLTAMLAVENIFGARHDAWQVNSDLEYHEEMRRKGQAVVGAPNT